MKKSNFNKIFTGFIMLIFICCNHAQASDQFLKVGGKILNRSSVVCVGEILKPCKNCIICSYSDCDKWHFFVYPTTDPRNAIGINGTSQQDIQTKHKIVEDWLIKGK